MNARKAKTTKERSLTWLFLWLAFIVLLGLIGWIQAIVSSLGRGEFRGAALLLIPLLLFLAWFYWILRRIMSSREFYRRQVETGNGRLRLKDTLVFSLAWSREIFTNIPADRRPLIYNAYLLILLVVAVLAANSLGMGTILLILLLILASTNLLVWVVGSERQDRDRMEVELETARKMQMSLMPTRDFHNGPIEISGSCQPSAEVGGDHFDYIYFGPDPDRVVVSVVDVSGKGMAAAVTAIYASGAINSELSRHHRLEKSATNLNTAICHRKQKKQFISLLLAEIDISLRRLTFINAGQSRPLLLRNGMLTTLRGVGSPLPLGVREGTGYLSSEIDLQSGDMLLMYTDGVTDAVNEENEMFGSQRLGALFSELGTPKPPPGEIVAAIRQRLSAFAASARQFDDITLVAIRVD